MQVKKKDQILPLLVLHVAGDIPGLPGLFMAGVFSGSLRYSVIVIALSLDYNPPNYFLL